MTTHTSHQGPEETPAVALPDPPQPLPWFPDFAQALRGRTGRTGKWDLPDPGDPAGALWWLDLEAELRRLGATAAEADAAVAVIARAGTPKTEILGKLGGLIAAARRDRPPGTASPAVDPADPLAVAQFRSRVCPECRGTGETRRFLWPRHAGKFPGVPVGGEIRLYCDCPYGHHREEHAAPGPNFDPARRALRRIEAFQLREVGWFDPPYHDNKYRYHPDKFDPVVERPLDLPAWCRSPAAMAAHFQEQRTAAPRGRVVDADRPTCGVPAGLTPRQEAFCARLGADRRRLLNALDADRRLALLARVDDPAAGPAAAAEAHAAFSAVLDLGRDRIGLAPAPVPPAEDES